MTDSSPSPADLANAAIDIQHIGDVTTGGPTENGDGTVTMRNGRVVKTLARVIAEADANSSALGARLQPIIDAESSITLITVELGPQGKITRINDAIDDITVAAGTYPVALGDHDALDGNTLNDPRQSVTRTETIDGNSVTVRYRPRTLPFTVSLPFDPDDWFMLLPAGTVSQMEFEALRARVERLHPYQAPFWTGTVGFLTVEEGQTVTSADLLTLLQDPDSLTENLVFSLEGSWPDLAAITAGRELVFGNSSDLTLADYTLRVTDEGGRFADLTVQGEVYPTGGAPSSPPVWGNIDTLLVYLGDPIPSRDHILDVDDADTLDANITIAGSAPFNSGITFVEGVRGGTANAIGDHLVTLIATDDQGNSTPTTYRILIDYKPVVPPASPPPPPPPSPPPPPPPTGFPGGSGGNPWADKE